MSLLVLCDHCSHPSRVPEDALGRPVGCPHCKRSFLAVPLVLPVPADDPPEGQAIATEPPSPAPEALLALPVDTPDPQNLTRPARTPWALIALAVALPAVGLALLLTIGVVGFLMYQSSPPPPQAALAGPPPNPGPPAPPQVPADPGPALPPWARQDGGNVVIVDPGNGGGWPGQPGIDIPFPPVGGDLDRWAQGLLDPNAPPRFHPNVPRLRRITAAPNCVWGVAFSKDGKTLLTGSGYFGPPGHVKLWDPATGELRHTLLSPNSDVLAVAFHPEENLVASASGDEGLHLIDRREKRVVANLKHPSYVRSAAFSPDGKWLASNCEGYVKLWDVGTHAERWKVGLNHEMAGWHIATPLAVHPDGKSLAAGDGARNVLLLDAATGNTTATLAGHDGLVICTAYSPDGKTLAVGSMDNTVRLWDPATHKLRATLSGHRDWIFSVAFTPDGKTLASAGREGSVLLWDVATGKKLAAFTPHPSECVCVAFAPDGKILASGGVDGVVNLWDVSKLGNQ